MLRRHFLPALIASAARAQDRLGASFEGAHGTGLLIDAATRRPVAIHAPDLAGRLLVPPGSTVKPFSIAALMEAGKLRPGDTFRCPGELEIDGRNLACSRPAGLPPMTARTAIAWSCNCFVAHFAARFEPGELTRAFAVGLLSRSAWLEEEATGKVAGGDPRLLALGEAGVLVTPAALAMSYTRLAGSTGRAWMAPVLGGMEDAVEFGTGQRARVAGVKAAGKTGSVRAFDGAHLAWFAGFVPSAAPRYIVVVMLQGRSGGADAAPVAGRILEAGSVARSLVALLLWSTLPGVAETTVRVRLKPAVDSTIVEMPLEEYVAAVVAGEAGSLSSTEALRAMAVAARSYAIHFRGRHGGEGYDLCGTTHCQRAEPAMVNARIAAAARATEGELLWYRGNVARALYSRDCGGMTEDDDAPYLRRHSDPVLHAGRAPPLALERGRARDRVGARALRPESPARSRVHRGRAPHGVGTGQ